MAKLIKDIPTFSDKRGDLTVFEKILNFEIKRMFTIYNVPENTERGGHGHFKTQMAMIALAGGCTVEVQLDGQVSSYELDTPNSILLLDVMEWHSMYNFRSGTILLVLASEEYDKNDYFTERR